ncbi:MAG: FixG Ig-like domain-containing protein, partial [Hyphomicrobiaceae bacterium]
ILNKRYETRTFKLSIDGLPGAKLAVLGMEQAAVPEITVVPEDLREVRAYVTVPRAELGKIGGDQANFRFLATDAADGLQTSRTTNFRKP